MRAAVSIGHVRRDRYAGSSARSCESSGDEFAAAKRYSRVASFMVGTARRDHGSNAVSETRERDHGHVHHEKKHQETGREEMNCPGRLLPAEDCDDRGYDRHDGGRHGEAREDDQWKKHENDCKVGEPLDNVVTSGLGVAGGPQAQMIRHNAPQWAPAERGLGRQQILAEMLREETG